jgi:uncharacterized integral membrane protein
MQLMLIFSLIIAVLAVLFAIQNNQQVTVSFLFWSFQASSALVIIISVLTGVLISLLVSTPALTRDKLRIRNLNKKAADLETQLGDANVKLAEAQNKYTNLEKALAAEKVPPAAEMSPPPASENQLK